MPLAVLVQVKRQVLHFKFREYFCSVALFVWTWHALASTRPDSWLKWALSFDEESRARHISAERDR
jgi:hypothetical protein